MAVKLIDFSPKHDIMIQNKDGSLIPMDEPFFQCEQIDADTWKVLSAGDFCYIVRGDGEALAVDCGYGAGNIRAYMESIAGVPVPYVANSHDHFDHTACNAYFDKAYMSKLTAKYATIPFQSFSGIDFHADEYERVVVGDGDIIPLKGRELLVIDIADHAPGSLMYLDRKNRILFTGDEIFPMMMGKPLNRGLRSWVNNLQKIKAHIDEFDFGCGGNGVLTKEHIVSFIQCAEYAIDHLDEAKVPQPRGPRPNNPERDSEGHIIYDRTRPHPGDHGVYDAEDDATPSKPENMRMIEYAGTKITFDITKVDM
jgi:glyoxylase-like metal-dependent hydrolase (beta-lactamase superfamily II)